MTRVLVIAVLLLALPAYAADVVVMPSTQPVQAVEIAGQEVLVQPAPTVKVETSIKDWIIVAAGVIGVITTVLLPAVIILLNKLAEVRKVAAVAFARADEQEKRIDRQGKLQSKMLAAMPQGSVLQGSIDEEAG